MLLIPLTFALFTPLGVPGFAWWAAALNSLPMLAAMAWACADAILLVRTGNQRYAVTGLLAYFVGLLFFEKAAVIPFVAFAITALAGARHRGESPLRTVWQRGKRLWTSSLALTAAWIVLYLVVVDQQRWSSDLAMTWNLLRRSVTHGIVPGLVGGPWSWDRWAPASPWATPSPVVMALGWVALATVLAVSLDPQAAHRARVAGRRRLRHRLPGPDLPHAVVAVHRARTRPDPAVLPRPRRRVGPAAPPSRSAHPNRDASRWLDASAVSHSGDRLARAAFVVSQPLLHRHLHDQLA